MRTANSGHSDPAGVDVADAAGQRGDLGFVGGGVQPLEVVGEGASALGAPGGRARVDAEGLEDLRLRRGVTLEPRGAVTKARRRELGRAGARCRRTR
jgi:hypothetical protein